MQRWFLARERMEVRGGEGEGDGVGEGAVGEGGELGGYGAVEAVFFLVVRGLCWCVDIMGVGRRGEGGGGWGFIMEKGKRRSYAITGLLVSGGMFVVLQAGKSGKVVYQKKKKKGIVYAVKIKLFKSKRHRPLNTREVENGFASQQPGK